MPLKLAGDGTTPAAADIARDVALGVVDTQVNRMRTLAAGRTTAKSGAGARSLRVAVGWTTVIGTDDQRGFQVTGNHAFVFKDGRISSLKVTVSPKADASSGLALEGFGGHRHRKAVTGSMGGRVRRVKGLPGERSKAEGPIVQFGYSLHGEYCPFSNIRYYGHIHCTAKMAEMQTKSEHERERETLDAFISALETLPHVRASSVSVQYPLGPSRHELDAEVDFLIADKDVMVLVEVKRTVYPRDVRQILWQLNRAKNEHSRSRKQEVLPLVAAESISVGARELLRQENVGFFDTGGSLFVPAKGAYVYVERPVPKTVEKSVRSLFTGKRSQVLHALLIRHRDWVGVTELSDLAEVSPGTASETLTALERMDWVTARGQGPSKERRLSDASGLLDEWQRQIQDARHPLARRRYYVPGGNNSDALAHRLATVCKTGGVEYVLTQDAAAQQYAPFLSNVSRVACRMSPAKSAGDVLANLDARVVTEGANLDVIETTSRGEFLFKEQRGQLWLASPIQVYLDLLRNEGRSRDMAEHLRKEVLGI